MAPGDAPRQIDQLPDEQRRTSLSKAEVIGKFSIMKTKARTGRNPRTGEPVKIAAAKRVKFTVAKALKTAANG